MALSSSDEPIANNSAVEVEASLLTFENLLDRPVWNERLRSYASAFQSLAVARTQSVAVASRMYRSEQPPVAAQVVK